MSEWGRCTIRELTASPISGSRPAGGISEDTEGIPSLGGENIQLEGGVSYDTIKRIPEDFFGLMTKGHAQVDDVLINKDGAQTGKVGLYDGRFENAAVNEHLFILRSINGSINQKLLYYYLLLPKTQADIARRITGSAQPGLNSQFVDAVSLTIPLNHKEQRRIAEIISTLDETIEQTETLIAKYQQIKAGLMHDLFTRGVTPDGKLRPPRSEAPHLYRKSPLGWIPKEWNIHKLQQLADINRGKFGVRPRNDPRYYGGEYPFIQTGDVTTASGRIISNYAQTLNSLGLTVSKLFSAGTIMVTIAANIADTCILGIPMCAPDSLVGVTPNRGEVTRYLELCIRRRKRWFGNRAPQTAQKNINLEDLRPLNVPYPKKNEQLRIAERYETIDRALTQEEERATKLSQLKRGFMHDLLTGRVRVPMECRTKEQYQ